MVQTTGREKKSRDIVVAQRGEYEYGWEGEGRFLSDPVGWWIGK